MVFKLILSFFCLFFFFSIFYFSSSPSFFISSSTSPETLRVFAPTLKACTCIIRNATRAAALHNDDKKLNFPGSAWRTRKWQLFLSLMAECLLEILFFFHVNRTGKIELTETAKTLSSDSRLIPSSHASPRCSHHPLKAVSHDRLGHVTLQRRHAPEMTPGLALVTSEKQS